MRECVLVRRVYSGALQILLELLVSLISALGSSVRILAIFSAKQRACSQASGPCLNRTNLVPRSHSVLHLDLGTRLKSDYFSREVMGTFVIFKTRQHCT